MGKDFCADFLYWLQMSVTGITWVCSCEKHTGYLFIWLFHTVLSHVK